MVSCWGEGEEEGSGEKLAGETEGASVRRHCPLIRRSMCPGVSEAEGAGHRHRRSGCVRTAWSGLDICLQLTLLRHL